MVGLTILISVFLLLANVPVAFAFGIGAIFMVTVLGVDYNFVMPIAWELTSSYLFLALPLYILAGNLMGDSGIADRFISLFISLFGRFRGGLGAAVILTNVIFGAVSGAASSAVGALGTIFIPRLAKEGYPRGYAVALTASTAVLSLLIPPSLAMIIFGVLTHLPITVLFLCTVGPALILTTLFLIINNIMSRKFPVVINETVTIKEYVKINFANLKKSSWGLLMPLIILGGIYSGIFTPTEAACVAVIYCFPVGFFIYRTFNFKNTSRALVETGVITASIVVVFFFLFIFSRIFIVEDIPEKVAGLLTQITTNKYAIFALLDVLMIIIGMIMDDTSGLVIAAIILSPIATSFGMDPRHFAAIAGVATGLGLITPPVAPTLYMASRGGGGVPLEEYIKPAMIFVIFAYLPVLILTTYVPQLALYIPKLILGGIG